MSPKRHPHPAMIRHHKDHTSHWVLGILLFALALVVGVAVVRVNRVRAQAGQSAAWDGDYEHLSIAVCKDDATRFCSDLPSDSHELVHCLGHHLKDLSTTCSEYVEMVDPADDWSNVCRGELASFCTGRSHKVECLRENRSRLTPRCLDLLSNYDEGARWRGACGEDVARLCSAETDEMHVRACLQTHRRDLSTACGLYLPPPS